MTEPGSVDRSWLGENRVSSEWADPDDRHMVNGHTLIGAVAGKQLRLELGDLLPERTDDVEPAQTASLSTELPAEPVSPSKSATRVPSQKQQQKVLLAELEQLRSLTHKQVERIHHLEQALDQSLAFQEELRRQLGNQAFLENQLAATEEIANIQQQAITQLKQQLVQRQPVLDNSSIQEHPQSSSFQAILQDIETLTEGQQKKLELLRTQIHGDRAAVQTQRKHLTKWLTDFQATIAAQQQRFSQLGQSLPIQPEAPNEDGNQAQAAAIQELSQKLTERDASIQQLETELHRAHIALQEQQALIDGLKVFSAKQFGDNPALGRELFTAHCKIQELETQVSKQTTSQAMLQHSCQELEQTRERHQSRIAELETQAAEMQEQILEQAQQASEYETAIQHWKDRYLNSENYLSELKKLIEKELPTPSAELADLITAIQSVPAEAPDTSPTVPNPRKTQMDLPDFLMRRQRHRVRS